MSCEQGGASIVADQYCCCSGDQPLNSDSSYCHSGDRDTTKIRAVAATAYTRRGLGSEAAPIGPCCAVRKPYAFAFEAVDSLDFSHGTGVELRSLTDGVADRALAKLGCARRCHIQAVWTIVFRSDNLGVKPSSERLSEASATRTGGSPSRRGAFETDKFSPVSVPMTTR